MENPETWTPLERLINDYLDKSPYQLAEALEGYGFVDKVTDPLIILISNEFNMFWNMGLHEYGLSLPKILAEKINGFKNQRSPKA